MATERNKDIVAVPKYRRLFSCTVRPSKPLPRRRCDLTPVDLLFLSDGYNQKGLLYRKPSAEPFESVAQRLQTSLSRCLVHFYPLAGRLATDPETTVFIDCNHVGVEFIAGRCHLRISHLLQHGHGDGRKMDAIVPPDVINTALIPYDGAINHDGHTISLLAVQVTELADGIFLGFAFNHCVADGTSLAHFLSTWAELSLPGHDELQISRPPVLDRSLFFSSGPLGFIPTTDELTKKVWPTPLSERIFRFPSEVVSKLKAKANGGVGNGGDEALNISSLQALCALMWRAMTRARDLPPEKITTLVLLMDNRQRLDEPLPVEYFGNCPKLRWARGTAAEVVAGDLGSVARTELVVGRMRDDELTFMEEMERKQFVVNTGMMESCVLIAGSPRFDLLGKDFGLGRGLGLGLFLGWGVSRATRRVPIHLPVRRRRRLHTDPARSRPDPIRTASVTDLRPRTRPDTSSRATSPVG